MTDTKFKKGHLKKGGKKKGTPNKFTTLKQAYIDAFNSEELGGTQGLIDAFKPSNMTKRDFYKLISKMLPTNIDTEVSGEISVTIKKVLTDVRPEE